MIGVVVSSQDYWRAFITDNGENITEKHIHPPYVKMGELTYKPIPIEEPDRLYARYWDKVIFYNCTSRFIEYYCEAHNIPYEHIGN
jgi:hypothetical protein